MKPPKQFWMVHSTGPTNVRHDTEGKALAEAKRLARANPGVEFYVTEAVTLVLKHDCSVVSIRSRAKLDDGIPF